MVVYSFKEYLNWNKGAQENVKKIHNERTQHTYKCKCGHSVTIRPGLKKVLCNWCNRYVFKNEEDEFKYRVKEQMNKK